MKEGEVLIDLDPTRNQAETSHLKSDLIAAKLDVARLHAALSDGDVLAKFDPPEGVPKNAMFLGHYASARRPPVRLLAINNALAYMILMRN